MAHVEQRDRQLQRSRAARASLYANRVRRLSEGGARPGALGVKWAILVVCLAVYYTLPWLRWDRGPGVPDQAVLLDLLASSGSTSSTSSSGRRTSISSPAR